jgi:hypothetical protein
MATKIGIPGTDEEVDTSDASGSAMSVVTAILSFGLAAMAASLGVKIWNMVADKTPDAAGEGIDVI